MKPLFRFAIKLMILFPVTLPVYNLDAQQSTSDTAYFSHSNMCLSASDPTHNTWVVYGQNCDSIAYVKPDKVLDISQKLHLPEGITFTCILPLDNRTVLLGTASDYIYMLRDRRFVRLDKSYGLTDSSIVSMSIDQSNKVFYVMTARSKFVLHNGSTSKDFGFTEIGKNGTAIAAPKNTLRRCFRKPLQKAVCDIVSDIDLSFGRKKYIGSKELETITASLHPGDIMIKRNDFQVANIGISGFFTHSGIYLGSLELMDRYFEGIPMLQGQKASTYIRDNYNEIYRDMQQHKPLIIEAVGEGVIISPLDHIARVDYFAALRPNLPKEEIFRSLLTAFTYLGTPYDFLFDFSTDDALVCSELIYKSYSETPDKKGIVFFQNTYEGNFFFYPSDFVRQYCMQQGSESAAFSYVIFYDADLKDKKIIYGDLCNTLERHTLFRKQ